MHARARRPSGGGEELLDLLDLVLVELHALLEAVRQVVEVRRRQRGGQGGLEVGGLAQPLQQTLLRVGHLVLLAHLAVHLVRPQLLPADHVPQHRQLLTGVLALGGDAAGEGAGLLGNVFTEGLLLLDVDLDVEEALLHGGRQGVELRLERNVLLRHRRCRGGGGGRAAARAAHEAHAACSRRGRARSKGERRAPPARGGAGRSRAPACRRRRGARSKREPSASAAAAAAAAGGRRGGRGRRRARAKGKAGGGGLGAARWRRRGRAAEGEARRRAAARRPSCRGRRRSEGEGH
mmetsp:Transcript_19076/g.73415  ORF Transcript_19076/g.73415 Transcript_19076/m.73415 type:complete len:293 (-) Transcript_19076:71-949(-)